MLDSYSVRLSIFITLAIVAGVALFLLFFYKPIKKRIYSKNLAKYFYSGVRRIVVDGDFYLINNINIKDKLGEDIHIDHLIGGDKYLYVITDRMYDGALLAKVSANQWSLIKGDRKEFVPNPIQESKNAINMLNAISHIDPDFFIGIVLINDDVEMTPIEVRKGEPIICPASKLKKTIASFEKENVTPFDKRQLESVIADFDRLSGEKEDE